MNLRKLFIGISLLACLGAYAHDFTVTVGGQRLYFEITNKAKKTAAVTYSGSIAEKKIAELNGIVTIPAKVKHNDVVYEINAIGQKAFANAKDLRGIVIPSGVDFIGDFAFENCASLKDVVFPGNPIMLGQGVFFNCPSISNVTIGSDWKTVDLTMFRWSKLLAQVTIPAKIEKIQGLKKLKSLMAVNVDPNNTHFSSVDGILYSKDGAILYACPRSYKNEIVVKDGVTKVLNGALIDCDSITVIDFPASVQTVSFRETSRMKVLETIVMRSDKPIDTGFADGVGKFFFELANPKVHIVVLAAVKQLFEAALAIDAGEYAETADGIPYMVPQSAMPSKKNLKGVKNFDKY